MTAKYINELEILIDELVAVLFGLEQVEERIGSVADFANDTVAATLHEVAHNLGTLSLRVTALAWSINAQSCAR
jgi:hypothetical protein